MSVPRNQFFNWRHLRIHVQERGEGEPLLLINGLGANTDMWEMFASEFPDRRILLFDAPGAGRSTTPAYPISIPWLSDLARAVLDFFDIESADVLGYSYGGAIAQQLAWESPERVEKLVLAATNCGVGALLGAMPARKSAVSPSDAGSSLMPAISMVSVIRVPVKPLANARMPSSTVSSASSRCGRLIRRQASARVLSTLTDTRSAWPRRSRTSGRHSRVPLVIRCR